MALICIRIRNLTVLETLYNLSKTSDPQDIEGIAGLEKVLQKHDFAKAHLAISAGLPAGKKDILWAKENK